METTETTTGYVTLIIRNAQGASEQTKHTSREDAADHVMATWHDPQGLTAQLIDQDGETIYCGSADEIDGE